MVVWLTPSSLALLAKSAVQVAKLSLALTDVAESTVKIKAAEARRLILERVKPEKKED
jgi:hypothetical protein